MRVKWVIYFLAAFYSSTLSAADRFSVINFRPSLDGLVSTETARPADFGLKFGTILSYEYLPFNLADNGSRRREIVNHLAAQHVSGVFAAAERLSLSLDMPVIWSYSFKNPDPAVDAVSERRTAIGDLRLQTKWLFLGGGIEGLGLAIVPFITFPTGGRDDFLGNDGVTGGGRLVLSLPLIASRLGIHFNSGFTARKHVSIGDIDFGHQIELSAGARYRATKRFSLVTEVQTFTPASDFFGKRNTSPAEVRGAVEFNAGRGFVLQAGAGGGMIFGAGSPMVRGFVTIGYKTGRPAFAKRPPSEPPTQCEISEEVFFDFGSHTISNEVAIKLGRIADLLYYGCCANIALVEGSTDNYGPADFNRRFSERRAHAVKRYLEYHGIAPERIRAVGLGETGQGRLHRRVLIRTGKTL